MRSCIIYTSLLPILTLHLLLTTSQQLLVPYSTAAMRSSLLALLALTTRPSAGLRLSPVALKRPALAAHSSPVSMGLFDFLSAGKAGAKHILVSDRAYANKIMGEIEAGKISFEEAARVHSTCPSASKGGDLGTFGQGQMVPAFNDYCFDPATPLNKLGVVKTKFGAHIIKLTKKP